MPTIKTLIGRGIKKAKPSSHREPVDITKFSPGQLETHKRILNARAKAAATKKYNDLRYQGKKVQQDVDYLQAQAQHLFVRHSKKGPSQKGSKSKGSKSKGSKSKHREIKKTKARRRFTIKNLDTGKIESFSFSSE